MIDYWIIGMSLYGCLVFLLLINLSFRVSHARERPLWVGRMVFTTYLIELVGLWAFSTFEAAVSNSLIGIGGLSLFFLTVFMVFFIVAVLSPREPSLKNNPFFSSLRSIPVRALFWIFGD